MTIRYRASPSFDAKREVDELITKFSNPGREVLYAIIDAVASLREAKDTGFNGIRHKWDATGFDGLFVYTNSGVVAAMNVPGSGRAQTFDLTLLGIAYFERNEDEATLEFLKEMDSRRRAGAEHVWF
jgi:hypothetical protein